MNPEATEISITQHGKRHTVEAPSSDLTIDEMMNLIEGLLLSCGYRPDTLKDYFQQ